MGGRLCLDFANTVSARIEPLCREYLTTYGELVGWSQHAGILTDDEAEILLSGAVRRPDLASAVLERAIDLRETLYQVFEAIADQREPRKAALGALNAALHGALSRLEVHPSAGEYEWAWLRGEDELDWMLWPIVRSAADLLTSTDIGRVRQCAREGCDWLFVDSSKNQSRRWCSMDLCGSRVKARRYYRRRKRRAESQGRYAIPD